MHRIFADYFRRDADRLNENGILILASVTGGERKTDAVPSDKINQHVCFGKPRDGRHGQRRTASISRWA